MENGHDDSEGNSLINIAVGDDAKIFALGRRPFSHALQRRETDKIVDK